MEALQGTSAYLEWICELCVPVVIVRVCSMPPVTVWQRAGNQLFRKDCCSVMLGRDWNL
jgi:hypothetical protein